MFALLMLMLFLVVPSDEDILNVRARRARKVVWGRMFASLKTVKM